MEDNNIKFRWKREFLSNLISFSVVFLLLSVTVILVNQSDKAIIERMNKYQFSNPTLIKPTDEFSVGEQRIAKQFANDTLPGLIQKGLIKKYERHQSGTLLLVVGSLWNERSEFFKKNLLLEIFVHNKVSGYELRTKIIDDKSGKLYAQILPSEKIEFYN